MPSLVIFGASGFLGRALIADIYFPLPIKAVARALPADIDRGDSRVSWVQADLTDPKSLAQVLEAGDTVVNMAYAPRAGPEGNLRLIDNLIEACLRAQVSRLVHCSTANVLGGTAVSQVDETTVCVPRSAYERTKFAQELRVLDAVARGLDAAILRPTAIVGPGGKNLLSLAQSLAHGNRVVAYLRTCLYGARPMHLVPIRDVVAALLLVAAMPGNLNGEVYFVSSDDDPSNNFGAVQHILLDALGLPVERLSPIILPDAILSLLLRLRGRSETNIRRRYAPEKLRAAGFCPAESVETAVRAFGESIRRPI